jgi:hypothetical protein
MTAEEILARHNAMARPIEQGYTRAGTRNMAGRPEVEDKKLQVNVMIKGSIIEALTKKKVQDIMKEAVEAYWLQHNICRPSVESEQLDAHMTEPDLLG